MTVLTTAQALATHGRGAVRHRLATRAWQSPTRGVVVTHSGPIDRETRRLVVLAAAPSGSVLAGLTALEIAGLQNFASERVVIALPNGGRKPRSLTGVEAHQSIHLGPDDVLHRTPPRTTPARSVIDAASWTTSDRHARAIVISAIQQGLMSTHQIREALQRRPTQRRRGLVIESVLDAAGGIQSLPERDFEEARVRAGLSRPIRQRRVQGPGGRYYLDVWFELEQLAVEIHGIPHLSVQRWDADLFRANEIVIGGDRTVTFSSYAVRHERDAVVDQLRRAAAAPRPRAA